MPKILEFKRGGTCEVRKIQKMRRVIVEILEEGKRMHHVHGIMQFEVTPVRALIQAYRDRTGETLSLTAFIIHCFGHAVGENPVLNAYRKGTKVFRFSDVDVSTIIERETPGGKKVPTTLIVRRANTKSFQEIHEEIRLAQTARLTGTALGEDKQAKKTNLFLRLPKVVRKIIWWRTRRNPKFKKDNLGTVCVTAVGMFGGTGRGAGWAVPIGPWATMLTVGTIEQKTCHEDGALVDREFVNLTLSVDHDLVDGAPATRFVVRLKDMIESGYGLREFVEQAGE